MRGGVISKINDEPLNEQIHRILSESTFEYIAYGDYGFVFKLIYHGENSGFINPVTGEEVREFVIKIQSIDMEMSLEIIKGHKSQPITWERLIKEVELQKALYETSLEKFRYAVCPAILYYEGLTISDLENYIKGQFTYYVDKKIVPENYPFYRAAIILMEFVPSLNIDSVKYVPGTDTRIYYRRIQDLKNKAFTIYCMTLLCGINQNDAFGRNFLLDKNDKVVIIDFGVSKKLLRSEVEKITELVNACLADDKFLRDLKRYLINIDITLAEWLFAPGYPKQPYTTELLKFPDPLPVEVVRNCKSGLCRPTNTELKRKEFPEKVLNRYEWELIDRAERKVIEEADEREDKRSRRGGKTRKRKRTRRKV
jgi:hypothetical protein